MVKLSRKGPQSRVLILFNDVLLYGHPVPGGVKLRHQLPLQHMRVHSSVDDSLGAGSGGDQVAGFEFAIVSRKKSFLLRADTFEIRLQWMQALVNAVRDYEQRLKTFASASSPAVSLSPKTNILNPLFQAAASAGDVEDHPPSLDPPTSSSAASPLTTETLGEIAPIWVPDDRVSMCQLCLENFTFLLRRHHCRACGKVVCAACSRFRAILPYMVSSVTSASASVDAERVCEKCADVLRSKDVNVVTTDHAVRIKFKIYLYFPVSIGHCGLLIISSSALFSMPAYDRHHSSPSPFHFPSAGSFANPAWSLSFLLGRVRAG